jgi:HD-like signal output (HDOD) protein
MLNLEALLAHRFVMPSVPRVVALLLTELAAPQPDLRRIDQLLATDSALGMRVLQAANAPYFKLQGQIHSVAEALAVLRLGQIQAMVVQAAGQTSIKAIPGVDLPRFWSYCVDAARVARALSGLLRLNQQAAYTCGLLHGVGELAMRAAMPEAIALDATIEPMAFKRARAEHQAFGYCYTEVSAGMARQSHFPQVLVDALHFAHKPIDNEVYEPLAGVVHLAVWRARARYARLSPNATVVSFPAVVAEVMGLDIDMVLQQDPTDWSKQVPGQVFVDPSRMPPVLGPGSEAGAV